MTKHDCTTVITKVFLALDGELTDEQEKNFLEDINRCSHCLERYSIEQHFKHYLTEKIVRKHVDPDLIQRIKDKLKIEAVS